MIINSIKQELKRLSRVIEKEQNISYSEIFFLQEHKKEIMEMGDIVLAQWADISEQEWNNGYLAQVE